MTARRSLADIRIERLYHVQAVNVREGWAQTVTVGPGLTHAEACTVLGKYSRHPARYMRIVEACDAPRLPQPCEVSP